MTDDLLQRLRTLGAENGDIHGQCGSALLDAADKIERLCGEVERLQSVVEIGRHILHRAESAERERDAAIAEIARERTTDAQIRALVDIRFATGDNGVRMLDELVAYVRSIVEERDALRESIAKAPDVSARCLAALVSADLASKFAGKRVRLVVEDGGK